MQNSITFVLIPIVFDIIFMISVTFSRLFLRASLILPLFLEFIHILNPQFLLQPFHFDGPTHYLLHFFFSQLLLLDFKLIESLIIGLEVHQFIGYYLFFGQL